MWRARETMWTCFALRGSDGKSERGKCCCKRSSFRPHRNKSDKTQTHLGPELPNLEGDRSVHACSITWIPLEQLGFHQENCSRNPRCAQPAEHRSAPAICVSPQKGLEFEFQMPNVYSDWVTRKLPRKKHL